MTKLIRWTAGLLLLLAATVAGANFYLRSLLPDYQGRLRIEGLRAPAKVYFDA